MGALLAPILIDAATRVGAPVVKDLLEKYLGGTAADIGGTIIDTIAGHAGVTPADLPDLSADKVDAAVKATEQQTSELLIQWNVQQRQAIELMRAEMDKGEATWTWAWRPAWMWFLGFLWLFRFVAVPAVDAALGSSIAVGLPFDTLFWLTATFAGFYMGGHTVKDGLSKWMGRVP